MGKQRDRGRILTEAGKEKIKQAIRAWEFEHERRCTQEKLRELTGLDPTTSSKILNAKGGADRSKIEDLFRAFGLPLEESDLRSTLSITAPEPNPNFVGREDAISDLNTLVQRGAKLIVIQARGGVGKTTLAWEYLKTQGFDLVLELWMAKETQNIASVEGVLEEWLRRYFDEEPGREFGVTLERLRQKLRDPSRKIGILIDNLEPALDQSGKFIEGHRRYVELMRVLSDRAVQSVTLITSRERLQEVDFGIEHYLLRSLDQQAWQEFFEHHGIEQDETALAGLHRAYGGNAKAMEILRSVVQADFSGNLAEYWQANQDDLFIERALEDLVIQQFDRLQQHDLNAYNLLCRIGCYRFQDVPTVPLEGLLCLLWDVPESKRRRVVRSLQERSLVELKNTEFFLHPVIRAEATKRLRCDEDWYTANQVTAKFWKRRIVDVEDVDTALRAFEAYYHYIFTNDFIAAADLILEERKDFLGRIFYKLGLVKQMIVAIDFIIDKVESEYHLSGLYANLGTLYRLMGNIHQAIYCHRKSDDIASLYFKTGLINSSGLQKIKVHNERDVDVYHWQKRTLLDFGICEIELGNLEKALDHFQRLKLSQHHYFLLDGICDIYSLSLDALLAFTYSSLGYDEEARTLAQEAYDRIKLSHDVVAHQFIFLGRAHKNLGEFEKSTELFSKVVMDPESSNYIQAKANAISGLAEIAYLQRRFNEATMLYLESIDSLENLGIKFDLAEASYQLGLTYQAMQQFDESRLRFDRSLELFVDIEAPRQIDRVRRAIQSICMED